MRLAWLACAVLVVAGAPALADEWSHRYPVKDRATVRLKADDGSVRIVGGASSHVEVHVKTKGWKIAPGGVTVKESQAGDRVEIEVLVPKATLEEGSVAVELRLPAAADLDVETGDGGITARGVAGRVRLSTGNGGIQARGRFEALELKTGDGAIEAEVEAGSKLAGPGAIQTGDGSITLRTAPGFGAEIDAETGEGKIEADRSANLHGSLTKKTARGPMGPGGPALRVYTSDGSIRFSGL
jgi:DUF4097 and DUF4098 domain-containing protein YvlB